MFLKNKMQTSNFVENPVFKTGKLEKTDANGLQPLNSKQLNNIEQSFGFFRNYYVKIDADGNPYAYYFENGMMIIDHFVIPVLNRNCYHLFNYQNCPTNSEGLPSYNEDEPPNDPDKDDPDLEDLTSKLGDLLQNYQGLSHEEIVAINVLLIQITAFDKSIILSNGLIHDKFREIFDKIFEYVKSLLESKKFIQNEDISEIKNFLDCIATFHDNKYIKYNGKEYPIGAVYRNSKTRKNEDLKWILRYLEIEVPNAPKVVEFQNGKRKEFFVSPIDSRFNHKKYQSILIDEIMKKVRENQEIRKKLSHFVSIWKETAEDFEKFIHEVQQLKID